MSFFHRRFTLRHFWLALIVLARQSRTFQVTCLISFLLLLFLWVLPLWRIVPLAAQKPFLPLHYNVLMGIDRFGPWYHVFIFPALGTLLFFLNTIFEALFYQKARVLSSFFAYGTLITEGLLLASLIFMMLLNV